jgi:hypothetical protein
MVDQPGGSSVAERRGNAGGGGAERIVESVQDPFATDAIPRGDCRPEGEL